MPRASLGSIAFVGLVVAGCNSIAGIEPAAVKRSENEFDDEETRDENASEPAPPAAPTAVPDAGPTKPPGPCDKYPNAKLCNGKCVYIDDPSFGCTPTSCMPCLVAHATPSCSKTFECVVAQCADEDWGDCDGKPENGCEVDLDTPSNCGRCGVKCGANAPHCNHGSCSATPRTD